MIRVLRDTILELDESLRWNKRKVANIDDNLSMCTFRSEERRLEIEKLEVDDIVRIKYCEMIIFSNHTTLS